MITMLSNDQLQAITINKEAIELVPEAFAREYNFLPVAVEGVLLQIISPAELTDAEHEVVVEKLRSVLNREINCDRADGEELSRIIDLHYTAIYSTIQNCDRKFRYRCPMQWAELSLTNDAKTRWCTSCERDVTFCMTDDEVDRLASEGKCVAFFDGDAYVDTLGLPDVVE